MGSTFLATPVCRRPTATRNRCMAHTYPSGRQDVLLPTGVEHAGQPSGSPAAVGLQPARGLRRPQRRCARVGGPYRSSHRVGSPDTITDPPRAEEVHAAWDHVRDDSCGCDPPSGRDGHAELGVAVPRTAERGRTDRGRLSVTGFVWAVAPHRSQLLQRDTEEYERDVTADGSESLEMQTRKSLGGTESGSHQRRRGARRQRGSRKT